MDEILYKEETISKIKDYLERDENIIFAYIFGSYATRAQRKQSDIDIALYFNKPPHGVDILKFVNKLSNLVAKEIHLVILNTASPFLKHQVMAILAEKGILKLMTSKNLSIQ